MATESFEDRLAGAIARSLERIEGLQETPYMLSNVTGPSAEVISGRLEFDEAFARGTDEYQFTIRCTVGGSSVDIGDQKWLRRLRAPSGPDSVKEALEADRTFGGLAQDARVTRISPMRMFQRPGTGGAVLGVDVELQVYADGNQD